MRRNWREFATLDTNWRHFFISMLFFQIFYAAMWWGGFALGVPILARIAIGFGMMVAWSWWFLPYHRSSFTDLLCCWFDYHEIEKDEGLYLRRWFLCKTRWGCVYLHQILKGDDDPDPHDHPWDFATFILKNGYMEYRWRMEDGKCVPDGIQMIHPLRLYKRKAETIHQVRLFSDAQPAWTLVFRGTYRRHWNFVREDGPQFWREYLNFWGADHLDPFTRGDIRLEKPRDGSL